MIISDSEQQGEWHWCGQVGLLCQRQPQPRDSQQLWHGVSLIPGLWSIYRGCLFVLYYTYIQAHYAPCSCHQMWRKESEPHMSWGNNTHLHERQCKCFLEIQYLILVASFPGSPRTLFRTANDRKLGGAWEQGYDFSIAELHAWDTDDSQMQYWYAVATNLNHQGLL